MSLLATMATGCKTASVSEITGSSGGALAAFGRTAAKTGEAPSSKEDWRRETLSAGERYRADPNNVGAALDYAEALRRTGQRAQTAAVLQQASIRHPHDKRLLGAYGRALADTGNLSQAMEVLSRAHTPDQPDWRILSAQGAVLDQMGRHEEARRYYITALKIVPGEPTVLSNLGLSYALAKDLKRAEETLRKASAGGKVDHRVRQNLALVVGLQGRFNEAEEIARADLPPVKAAENIAYLRQMLAQHEGDKPRGRAHASNRAG
ncbi:MAG TPA: tetratricopeptide repeat protein [Xanthobacteraceae bacterium]|nr:tetratricopeptide repeat protein [Xanthobacteraceae bacterium]